MGPARHARDKHETKWLRRRLHEEKAEETLPLKGYSRNGVVGRLRDADGRTFWPECRGPPPPVVDEHREPSHNRTTTTGTPSQCGDDRVVEEPVNIKQEHSETRLGSRETATLRIENFRRPFTLSAVQAFVQQCGPMEDGAFWMDAIKSHCYVTLASVDVARELQAAVHGTVWPAETGQKLSVTYSSVTAMEVITNGPPAMDALETENETLKRKASDELVPRTRVIRGRGAPASIDSRFIKTETKPMLYYLPVPEAEVAHRKRERERKGQAPRDGSATADP